MSRRHARNTAGPRAPVLAALIAALEEEDRKDRPGEARALRELSTLAEKQVPARGIFAPAEPELTIAIEQIGGRHLGLEMPRKALLAATSNIEPFEKRDEMQTLANHWVLLSEHTYFYAGLAFGITFLQFDGSARWARRLPPLSRR